MDRREELRRMTPRRRVQNSPKASSTSVRKVELIRSLGVKELKPGEKVDFLHKGKVVGPPWMGGIFQTRLNWGTFVLAIGFILFIAWLVLTRADMGG